MKVGLGTYLDSESDLHDPINQWLEMHRYHPLKYQALKDWKTTYNWDILLHPTVKH